MFFYTNQRTIRLEVKTMNIQRKKELIEEWKNRRPEMGVISFRCKATGETFLGISKDTKADFNSNSFKLSTGKHQPIQRMNQVLC